MENVRTSARPAQDAPPEEKLVPLDPHPWELSPDMLRWCCDETILPFGTTAEVGPLGEIVGQARALKAIRLGLDIPANGYNIFVTGSSGTGRTSAVRTLVQTIARSRPLPPDLCYVHNFEDAGTPRALVLPAGQGTHFRRDMEEMVAHVRRTVPRILEGESHVARRRSLRERMERRENEMTSAFEAEVENAGFRLVAVQEGGVAHADIAPVVDGQPVSMDEVARLSARIPDGARKLEEIRKRHAELVSGLVDLLRRRRAVEREAVEELRELDRRAVMPVVEAAIQDLKERYPDEKVTEHLADVREALLAALADPAALAAEEDGADPGAQAGGKGDPFRLYRVNVVVDHSRASGAPVIVESNPTYTNLFGVVERPHGRVEEAPDEFFSIRAGSLLRANGGYLIIDAHDLMSDPAVWTALKRALKSRVAEIQNAEAGYVLTPSVIKPEPVKLALKVILIGDLALYHYLYAQDDDFRKVFKVRADFDSEMNMTEENLRRYAAFISKICQEESLVPLDGSGVAAVLEHGVRLTGRRGKLSVQFSEIADLVREASYWARMDGSGDGTAPAAAPVDGKVTRQHVEKAIQDRIERLGLLEEKTREMVSEGLILIETDGASTGTVNGLTVLEMGDYMFGRPVRISATAAMGRGGVINIERESYMSGKTHDKGVLILAGYLRGKYAQDKPLTVSASLCFEQSYGGVDGDSASSAELYAILSALSELPVIQGLACTGSVNQRGEIQAVGGVNEKIESFFDLCREQGLTGRQGVVIPRSNVKSLMLRPDLVDAVRAGRFHVYAVSTVDEGIALLTGIIAGERLPHDQLTDDSTSLFTPGSVNSRVDARLRTLAMDLKYYGEDGEGDESSGETGPRPLEEDPTDNFEG